MTAWTEAEALWGVRLHDPKDARGGPSFAWFSFPPEVTVDHRQVRRLGIEPHLVSVYAHEIGHHVLSPGTRLDALKLTHQMARAIAASGAGSIPHPEEQARTLSNLWSDLLVNTRVAELQRRRRPAGEPDMTALWRALSAEPTADPLWWVVLRTYELLWRLPDGTLCPAAPPPARRPAPDRPPPARHTSDRTPPARRGVPDRPSAEEEAESVRIQRELDGALTLDPALDAALLARTVRTFAADPVSGALRAGMVLAPYLRASGGAGSRACGGEAGAAPASLADLDAVLGDPRLAEPPVHPALDGSPGEAAAESEGGTTGQGYGLAATLGLYRGSDPDAVVAAWYTAEARRWIRPLTQPAADPPAGDEIPGPAEEWVLGDELADLDWPTTLGRSPQVVPGVTTRRRTTLPDPGPVGVEPVELELYVDSSGSMRNPRLESPAVLAGCILLLSVLRGGGSVRVTSFSGAGQVAGRERFGRDRKAAVADLATYFGGGTTFPLDLLRRRVRGPGRGARRHLVVLSDDGLQSMFGAGQPGLEDVAAAARADFATATLVLLDPRRSVAAAAAAARYEVADLRARTDAPRVCTALAHRIATEPAAPGSSAGPAAGLGRAGRAADAGGVGWTAGSGRAGSAGVPGRGRGGSGG